MFLPANMLLSSVSQKFIAEEVDDLEAKNAGDHLEKQCAALCRFVPLCAALCRFVPLCAAADTDNRLIAAVPTLVYCRPKCGSEIVFVTLLAVSIRNPIWMGGGEELLVRVRA